MSNTPPDTNRTPSDSLSIIDPSPVSTPALTPSPKRSPSSSTSYFTPGPHAHSTTHYLRASQRYSSYLLTAFAAVHITNTSLLPLLHLPLTSSVPDAVAASSTYLLLTRPLYQSQPLAEPLLLAALTTHISSGVLLRLLRRRADLRREGAADAEERRKVPWRRVSWTSSAGYAAAGLVGLHAASTRLLPWWVESGSSGVGLEFVGHGVSLLPRGVGAAAYAILVGVVGAHVVWGWGRWLELLPDGKSGVEGEWVEVRGDGKRARRSKRRWWGILGTTVGVVGLWMAGGVGVVTSGGRVEGWLGREYDDLYRRIPWLGQWV